MTPFDYHAPTTLADALAVMARGDARALAGGSDIIPQLREKRRAAGHVVDLKRIPDLTLIERQADGGWRIGAAATVGALGRDHRFAAEHAGLLESARLIGSLQIQNRASLGGNLCNAAPSADAVPLLICLDAMAEIAGLESRRTLPVEAVPIAPGRTALTPSELLVAIRLPPRPTRSGARYLRFTPRREMDIAIAGAGAAITVDARGVITAARIVLASVAPVPLVAARAAASLVGQRPSIAVFTAAATLASDEARPISDARGSADYRRDLVRVLTRRALEASARDIGIALA